MRASSAVAAALLASSAVSPALATPIYTNDQEARAISSQQVAQIGTIGLAGATLLGQLFGHKRELEEMEARAISSQQAAQIGTIGLAGATLLGQLFGKNKREELTADESALYDELMAAHLDARKVNLNTLGSIGGIVSGVTSGIPLISSLFGRDIDELEARASLTKIGNIAALGSLAVPLLGGLFGGSDKRDLDELEARASLTKIGNLAGLGSLAIPLLGGLFGGDKRDLSDEQIAAISSLMNEDVQARGVNLGTAANIASLGLSANNIIKTLFSREEMDELEARGVSLGTASNLASLGLSANNILKAFGIGAREVSMADLD
jgi:putative effector of murein hydrolase